MSNPIIESWRLTQLNNFSETIANLGYFCAKMPDHMGRKVTLECNQGHKFKLTPHDILVGKRCECNSDRPLESFNIAELVAMEELQYANLNTK